MAKALLALFMTIGALYSAGYLAVGSCKSGTEDLITLLNDLPSDETDVQIAALRRIGIPDDVVSTRLKPDFLQISSLAGHLTLVGVSWTWIGPKRGWLVLVDATGKRLSIRKMGGIESVRKIDLDGDRIEELLLETYHTGTGLSVRSFHLLAVESDALKEWWSDIADSGAYGGELGNEEVKGSLSINFVAESRDARVVYKQHKRELGYNPKTEQYDAVISKTSSNTTFLWSQRSGRSAP